MIGILAYGSLIDNPGSEINNATERKIKISKIPFSLEFARVSSTRNGAPTLIPVSENPSTTTAYIFVLKDDITIETAKNILWRRETDNIGTELKYDPNKRITPNTVRINETDYFADFDSVLFTEIASNIKKLTPSFIAQKAIESVEGKTGIQKKDGINYLLAAKNNGVRTLLMDEYEKMILSKTKSSSLEEAYNNLQKTLNA